jgi:hypothetical protein
MGGVRDHFSNFGFFEALAPQSFDGSASITGGTIDKRGYETITFIVHAGEISGVASALNGSHSCGWIRMQHGTSNAAGTVVWSNCSGEHIITDLRRSAATLNTSGMTSTSYAILAVSNAGSGLAAGTFFTLGGLSDISDAMWTSQAFAAGYVGDHRWVRLVVSVSDAADTSAVGIAAIAIAGLPGDWPVNEVRVTG